MKKSDTQWTRKRGKSQKVEKLSDSFKGLKISLEKHLLHANLMMLFPPTLENMEKLVNNTYREKDTYYIYINTVEYLFNLILGGKCVHKYYGKTCPYFFFVLCATTQKNPRKMIKLIEYFQGINLCKDIINQSGSVTLLTGFFIYFL